MASEQHETIGRGQQLTNGIPSKINGSLPNGTTCDTKEEHKSNHEEEKSKKEESPKTQEVEVRSAFVAAKPPIKPPTNGSLRHSRRNEVSYFC